MKGGALPSGEPPAQMDPAPATEGHLPCMARKPGEFYGTGAVGHASGCGQKTTDFEYLAVWVGNRMGMGAVDGTRLGEVRDCVAANTAENLSAMDLGRLPLSLCGFIRRTG